MLLCKFIYCTYICIDAFPLDVCAHANTDIYIHIETVKKMVHCLPDVHDIQQDP